MKIIGIGDLVLDFYYKDNILVGVDGGKSFSNIIFNLAHLGNKTAIIGNCGNDYKGKICIDSLKSVGVDTSNISFKDINTREFHISLNNDELISSRKCPVCLQKEWYEDIEIDNGNNIGSKDIIVVDEINRISNNSKNMIMLDLGYYKFFEKITKEEILNLISYKYEIINMNERVEEYLINRLTISKIELYKRFNAKLLIITRGKEGADFIYKGVVFNKKLEIINDEVDPNGAGDMFFASIINDYIKNNFKINKALIDLYFKNANKYASRVVLRLGSRSHFKELYKINYQCNHIS